MTDKVIKPLLCIIITIALILMLGAFWCITAENSSEWVATTAYVFDYNPVYDHAYANGSSACPWTGVANVTYNIQGIEYTNNLVSYIAPQYITGTLIPIMYKQSDPNIIKEYSGGIVIFGYICSIVGCIILACAGCITYTTYSHIKK